MEQEEKKNIIICVLIWIIFELILFNIVYIWSLNVFLTVLWKDLFDTFIATIIGVFIISIFFLTLFTIALTSEWISGKVEKSEFFKKPLGQFVLMICGLSIAILFLLIKLYL